MKVDRADLLDDLVDVLRSATAAALMDIDQDARHADLVLGSADDCDGGLDDFDELHELARRTESLAPFGMGLLEPTFELVIDTHRLRV